MLEHGMANEVGVLFNGTRGKASFAFSGCDDGMIEMDIPASSTLSVEGQMITIV